MNIATIPSVEFHHGSTLAVDPTLALEELDANLHFAQASAVILFVSTSYDSEALAAAIHKQIHVPVLCCTTAGEIGSRYGYSTNGMAGASIAQCRATLMPLQKLSEGGAASAKALRAGYEHLAEVGEGEQSIGLLVVDGLCQQEERIIERLQSAMPTVPIVGGSAGDACQFKQTMVYLPEGHFESDAGALLLISGSFVAVPFQTHHFRTSGARVVATEVDLSQRKLIALDGLPAAVRFAEILGCEPGEVTADLLATRPLLLRCGETAFVRAVRLVNADGSLSMFCAIRRGDVMHIGKSGDIVDSVSAYFDAIASQGSMPDLIVGFDCILRRMELALLHRTEEMNKSLQRLPFVGFSTFGEQVEGQHVNQTMTGVALWTK